MSGLIQRDEYLRVVRERDALKEQVVFFKGLLEPTLTEALRIKRLGFTLRESEILAAMMKVCPQAYTRLAFDSLVSPNTDARNLFPVFVCRIRDKLRDMDAPPGMILNRYGVGYVMTKEGRDWLAAAIQEPAQSEGLRR